MDDAICIICSNLQNNHRYYEELLGSMNKILFPCLCNKLKKMYRMERDKECEYVKRSKEKIFMYVGNKNNNQQMKNRTNIVLKQKKKYL